MALTVFAPMIDFVLIDSSIWIPYLRRNPNPEIVRRVKEWLDTGAAATTEIVKIELLQATKTEEEFQRLSATLDVLCSVTPDAATWRSAAWNSLTLRRSGLIVATTDLLIATLAQQAGARLAHADQHYEMMAAPLGLRTISFLAERGAG